MPRIDFRAFEDSLRSRLAELEGLSALSADSRQTIPLDQQSVGRLSRMGVMQQQAMDLATEERREQERARIGAALKRIESGDYGLCVKCGDEIGQRRLELDPSIPFCLACAKGKR